VIGGGEVLEQAAARIASVPASIETMRRRRGKVGVIMCESIWKVCEEEWLSRAARAKKCARGGAGM
jgi:hypothetical protein